MNGIRLIIKLDKHIPISGKLLMSATEKPATRLPIILPTPYASLDKIGKPLSINSSSEGNFSINAPTAIAKAPIPNIKPVNAVSAATPSRAKGAIMDIFTRILAMAFVKAISKVAFTVAF